LGAVYNALEYLTVIARKGFTMSSLWKNWSKRLWSRTWDDHSRPGHDNQHRSRRRRLLSRGLFVEPLERRDLLSGTWTALTNLAPGPIGTMISLSDGTVMAQNGDLNTPANRNQWYRLTPTSSGSYASGTWSNLASMSLPRLYYGSNVLPDGRVFVVGGEYTTSNTAVLTNTGEIYNPVTNSWSSIANFPQSQFGDDPTELLPDGRVLAGYFNGGQTYIYNPTTNSWSATGSKQRSDASDEESWVKLPDDSILSYDVWTEGQGGTNHAQRYIPSSGTWVDAGTVPTALSGGSSFGFELGGAVRLPDGRVWFLGANSHTAFYTPSTNTWTAGPSIPNNGSNQLQGADDAPVAMLPNGKVLLAVDHPVFNGPTNLYEFDPATNTYTNVTPSISGLNLNQHAYSDRMLVLPTGQVLFTSGGNQLAVYTPDLSPNAAWRPAANEISGGFGGTTFTLWGTQLNGLSEGATYGDDAEMSTNYPLVRVQTTSGTVLYPRTAGWSSTGVATGSTTEDVNFTVPARGIYLLNAIANGIASPTVLNVEMTASTNNLVIRNNPTNSAHVQVVSGSTVLAEYSLSSIDKILVSADNNNDTLTVSYQYGNPLPTNGLDYDGGIGNDTLNVGDPTANIRDYTLGSNSVHVSGSAPITFLSSAIDSVNVSGGSGPSYFTVDAGLAYTATINTGTYAGDYVYVRRTTGPLTVNVQGGAEVDVRNAANNLDDIQGAVAVHASNNGSYELSVDDQHTSAPHTYTVTATSISRAGVASISYANASAVTLYGYLAGGNTINVQGTPSNTVVDIQPGGGVVNVGSPTNSLDTIQGLLYVLAGVDQLNINDQGAGAPETYGLATGSNYAITRSGTAPILYGAGVRHLAVNGGSHGNTFNIEATQAGTTATVNTGSGANTINLSPTAHNLNNLAGLVNINGQGSNNTLDAYDQATTFAQSDLGDNLYQDHLTRYETPTTERTLFTYGGMQVVNMFAGRGDPDTETFGVIGTPAGVPVTVTDAGVSMSRVQFIVRNNGQLNDIQGPLTIHGRPGSYDSIDAIDDSQNPNPETYTVTANTVTRTDMNGNRDMAPIVYDNVTELILVGSSGGNTINVESTAAGTVTTVDAGSGGSTINLSPMAHNLANLAGLVQINGQGGANTLNAFDQATTFAPGSAGDQIYQDHLTRFNPTERTVFTFAGMQSINVSAGRSDNGLEIFGIVSTPAGVPVILTDASPTSQVEFFAGSPLDFIQGPLTVHGRAGSLDEFLVDDADNPNPHTYTVTANALTRTDMSGNPDMAPITYDNLPAGLSLYTSNTGTPATVNIQSSAAATPIGILLLSAGDQANVTAPGIQGILRIYSNGAVSVTVDDSGDSMPRTATFSTDPTYRYLLNGLAPGQIFLNVDPGSSIQVLGGSGGNSFNVQGLLPGATMSLDGGSGTNTLDYTGFTGSVVADLQTGVATGFSSIANIENVTGASGGGDQGFYNLLIGNGGNVLTGGFGRRNILVAGGSASTLNAGDGEDLLIGGYTSYDNDPNDPGLANWQQIAAYWAGTGDFFTRVANLASGTGVPILDPTAGTGTVFGNGGGNTMNGNGALALIYGDGADNITGFDPNSIIVPITP
jgi:hypothetical protein